MALCLLMAGIVSASPALFEVPLSENSVREAYFLGQRTDQKVADLLSLYRHSLPLPEKGPYISEVRLLTPYAQLVAESNRHTVGYSAQQAAAYYHGHGDTILIQFRAELTPTFDFSDAADAARGLSGELDRHLGPADFWRAFRITVSQAGESGKQNIFEPIDEKSEPIYADDHYIGTIVTMEYDAAKFGSAMTRVEIFINASGGVVTDFDLAALR